MKEWLSQGLGATDRLTRWLVGIALGALVVFVAVMVLDASQRSQLWFEVGKGAIQVFVIGVLGTSLKLLADDYQARRQRAEDAREARRQRAESRIEFRSDKYRRLVAATSKLRAVPIYMRASPSLETWTEQMPVVLAANAELRLIKHEIFSSSNLPDEPPFPKGTPIVDRIEAMYAYTGWVANEFAEYKRRLGERSGCAEDGISAVRSVNDMIEAADPALGESSWVRYLEAHDEALRLIIESSVGSEPERTEQ